MNSVEFAEFVQRLYEERRETLSDIAKKLPASRTYLSNILNAKKPKEIGLTILRRLQKHYPEYITIDDSTNSTIKGAVNRKRGGENKNSVDFQAKYYAKIEADNQFLQDLLKSSLITIAAGQVDLHAHLKTLLEHEAEKTAGSNLKKKQEEMLRLSMIVAAHKEALKGTGISPALSSVGNT